MSKSAIADLTARVEKLELKVKELSKESNEDKKGKKLKKEVEKKKRLPSGYNLYCKATREEIKKILEEELSEGEKLKSQDVMKKLGEMWKELSDDERNVWNTKAKTSNEEED